jgi:hypothetical protein
LGGHFNGKCKTGFNGFITFVFFADFIEYFLGYRVAFLGRCGRLGVQILEGNQAKQGKK